MIWRIRSNKQVFEKNRIFTYYIPAPPTRRSGYREKEFDMLMAEIIDMGLNIKSLTTQSHTGENSSGMWVICHLFGPESLDWSRLDQLASPLPKERENDLSEETNSDDEKEVDLPEMSDEEADNQLENLYTIDHEGPKS